MDSLMTLWLAATLLTICGLQQLSAQTMPIGTCLVNSIQFSFYPRATRRYASAGTSHGPVSVCLSVSVCHKSEFCRNG